MVRRDELKRADHIYTNCIRGVYDHHGIYVGKAKVTNPYNKEEQQIDDAVIHFRGIDKNSGSFQQISSSNTYESQCKKCYYRSNHYGVVITCLDCFLGGNSLYVYEYDVSIFTFLFGSSGSCSTGASYEPDKVIQTAFYFLHNQSFGEYSMALNNCEHFATYCKTGKGRSNQFMLLYRLVGGGAIAYRTASAMRSDRDDNEFKFRFEF